MLFLPQDQADAALALLRADPVCAGAVRIGTVAAEPGEVLVETPLGTRRVLEMLSGAQLPRIC